MTEAMVLANPVLRGRGDAGAGNPDRRMRLLDWSRPKVHHAELIMPAVPGENVPRRPGLDHQGQRFAETLALLDRDDAVRDGGVGRQPRGQSSDHPSSPAPLAHRVYF